jgi:hypothetical protein
MFTRLSGSAWLVSYRLKSRLGLPTFAQDLGRHLFAGSATHGNAQLTLEAPQILNPGLGGLADLLVGYRITDTNVHAAMETQMRMIVNSIKYKPRHGP